MTTKELSEVAGVSVDTVLRRAKEIYPARFGQGKRVVFTKDEAIRIMGDLRKKGFVELPQNEVQLPQNAEVSHLGAMVANLAVMMQETMKVMVTQQNQITAILSQPNQPNQPKQLAYTQDYFGVIAFANTKGLKPTITEAQQLGRMARAVSAAKGLEIRTMPDERWGKVNSYHVDVLKEVFAS